MKTNLNPCNECPFTETTRQPIATDELISVALERIADGEQWICHKTCGPGGSVNNSTRYCAAAPSPEAVVYPVGFIGK